MESRSVQIMRTEGGLFDWIECMDGFHLGNVHSYSGAWGVAIFIHLITLDFEKDMLLQ